MVTNSVEYMREYVRKNRAHVNALRRKYMRNVRRNCSYVGVLEVCARCGAYGYLYRRIAFNKLTMRENGFAYLVVIHKKSEGSHYSCYLGREFGNLDGIF